MKKYQELTKQERLIGDPNSNLYNPTKDSLYRFTNAMSDAFSESMQTTVAYWNEYQRRLAESKLIDKQPNVTIPTMGYGYSGQLPNPYLVNSSIDKENKEREQQAKQTLEILREGNELEIKSEEDDKYIQQAKNVLKEEQELQEAITLKNEYNKEWQDYVGSLDNGILKFGAGLSLGFVNYISNPVRLGTDLVVGTAMSTLGGIAGLGAVGTLALDYGSDIFVDIGFAELERKLAGEQPLTTKEKIDVAKDTTINKTILMGAGKLGRHILKQYKNHSNVANPIPKLLTSEKELGKSTADVATNQPLGTTDEIEFKKKMSDPNIPYEFAKDNRNYGAVTDTQIIQRATYEPKKNEIVQGENYFSTIKMKDDDINIIDNNKAIGNIDDSSAIEIKTDIENEYRNKLDAKELKNVDEYQANTEGINAINNKYTVNKYTGTIIKNNNSTKLLNQQEALEALFNTPNSLRAVYNDMTDNTNVQIIKLNDNEIYMIKTPKSIIEKNAKQILVNHSGAENEIIQNTALATGFLIDSDGNIIKSLSKSSMYKVLGRVKAEQIERTLAQSIYDLSQEEEKNSSEKALYGKKHINLINSSVDDLTKFLNRIFSTRNSLGQNDFKFIQELEFKDTNGKIFHITGFDNLSDGTLDTNKMLLGLMGLPTDDAYMKLGKYFREKAIIERGLKKGTSLGNQYIEYLQDTNLQKEIFDKIFIENVDGTIGLNTSTNGFFKDGIEEAILKSYFINPNDVISGKMLPYNIGDKDTLNTIMSIVMDNYDMDDINLYAIKKFLNNEQMDIIQQLGFTKINEITGEDMLSSSTFMNGFLNLIKEISNPKSSYDKEMLYGIIKDLSQLDKLPLSNIINEDGTTGSISTNYFDYILNNNNSIAKINKVDIDDFNNLIKEIPANMRTSIKSITDNISQYLTNEKNNVEVNKLTMDKTNSSIKNLEWIKKNLSTPEKAKKYIGSDRFKKDIEKLDRDYSILSFDNPDVFNVKRLSDLMELSSEDIDKILPNILSDIDGYLSNVIEIKQGINIPNIDTSVITTGIDELKNTVIDFSKKTETAITRIANVKNNITNIENKLATNKDIKKYVSTKKFAQNQITLANELRYLNAPKNLIDRLLKFDGTKYNAKTDKPKLNKLLSDIQDVLNRNNAKVDKANNTINGLIDTINSGNATDLLGQKNFYVNLERYVKQLKDLNIDGTIDSEQIIKIANTLSQDFNSKVIAENFIKNAKGLQDAIGILKQIDTLFTNKDLSPSYRYIKDKDAMKLFDKLNKLIADNPDLKTQLNELSIYMDATNKLRNIFDSLNDSKKNSPLKRAKDLGKEINLASPTKQEYIDNAILEKTVNKQNILVDKELFTKYENTNNTIIEDEIVSGKEIDTKGAFEKYVKDKHKPLFKEIYKDAIQYLKDDTNLPMSLDEFTVWYAHFLREVDTSRTAFSKEKLGYKPLIMIKEMFPSQQQFIDFMSKRKVVGHPSYQKTSAQLLQSLSAQTNLTIAEYEQLGQSVASLKTRLEYGLYKQAKSDKKTSALLSRSDEQRHILARVQRKNATGHAVTTLQEKIASGIANNLNNYGNKAEAEIRVTPNDITVQDGINMFLDYVGTSILALRGVKEEAGKGLQVMARSLSVDSKGKSLIGSIDNNGKYNIRYSNWLRTKRLLGGIANTGISTKDGYYNRVKNASNMIKTIKHFRDMENVAKQSMDFSFKGKYYGVDQALVDGIKANYDYRYLAEKANISTPDNFLGRIATAYNTWKTGVLSTQVSTDISQSIWGMKSTIEFINRLKDVPYENIDDASKFILKNNGIDENNIEIVQNVLRASDLDNGQSIVLNILQDKFDKSLYNDIDNLDIGNVKNLIGYLHREYGTIDPTDVFKKSRLGINENLAMFLRRSVTKLGTQDLRKAFFYQTPNGAYRFKLDAQLADNSMKDVIKWGVGGIGDNWLKLTLLATAGTIGYMSKNLVADISKSVMDIAEGIGRVEDIIEEFQQDDDMADTFSTALWDLNLMLLDSSKDNINAFSLFMGGGDATELAINVVKPVLKTWIDYEKSKGFSEEELKEKFGLFYINDNEPQSFWCAIIALILTSASNIIAGNAPDYIKAQAWLYPQEYGHLIREEKQINKLRKNDKYGHREVRYMQMRNMINKGTDALNYLINNPKSYNLELKEDVQESVEKMEKYEFMDNYLSNLKNAYEDMQHTDIAINQNLAHMCLVEGDITQEEYDEAIITNLESLGTSKNFNNLPNSVKDSINRMMYIKFGEINKVDALKFKAEAMMFMEKHPEYTIKQMEREFIPNIDTIDNMGIDTYSSFKEIPDNIKNIYNKYLKQYCTENEFLIYLNNGKSIREIIDEKTQMY